MAIKNQRILYQAAGNATGLTDVKAYKVRKDGVVVASNLVLSEVDSTNEKGLYELAISSSTITGWGGAGFYDFYIDSASHKGPAVATRVITANDDDDNAAQLTSISSQTTDIQSKVNNGTYGLAAIQALITSVQSAISSVQNNVNFSASVPEELVRPSASSSSFRVPINIYNTEGQLVDPDSNTITVTVANQAGVDRSSYLNSSTAVRDALGQYHVDFSISSSAPLEELIFKFSYTVSSVALAHSRSTVVILGAQSTAGLALQSTSTAILSDTDSLVSSLANATYGLAALQTLINSVQSSVAANGTALTAIEGTGFDTNFDSLHQISQAVNSISGRAF